MWWPFEEPFTKKMIYNESNQMTHLGEALPGMAAASPGWRIRALTYDENGNITDEKWASGNSNFDKVMDDYATYTYS